ncbi:tRNA (carboxymethyluridine(34)-5-O)-methyltransferase [Dirofilaria immitis]
MDIEEKYVRKVYGHLASYSDASYYRNRNRTSILRWINVQKFVNQFPLGTIAIDIVQAVVKRSTTRATASLWIAIHV